MLSHVLSLAVILTLTLSCLASHADKARLLDDLFENYDKRIEPVDWNVTYSVNLVCGRYCQFSKLMWTSGWELYEWKDSRLQWQPEKYGGVTEIHVCPDLIPKPDLTLFNTANPNIQQGDVSVFIDYTGNIWWTPPFVYETFCEVSASRNDTCVYKIGSWVHSQKELYLQTAETSVSLDDYDISCPFSAQLEKTELVVKRFEDHPDEYATFKFFVSYSLKPHFE